MGKQFKSILFAMLAMLAWPVFAQDHPSVKPLKVGVVPYISARALIANFEPLRLYLEHALGKPVTIYTAPGFKPFFLHASQGEYDLVISAAHFARILQKEHKFTPLVKFSPGSRALIMTAVNSPLKIPQDLRGQVIAVPDQLALASIVIMTWLRENGLHPGVDYKLLEVPSFASAILSVQKGDAMAAITASPILTLIPNELRESVRTLADAGEFNSFIFLAHPSMETASANLLKDKLLKFGSESNEGKQFFSNTGFGTTAPVSSKDMSKLDRYTAETKRIMKEAP